MMGRGETFMLRVKGESMRDVGILPGDLMRPSFRMSIGRRVIYLPRIRPMALRESLKRILPP